MAIERPIILPVKREERTDEVLITTPPDGQYVVRIVRVTRDHYADGSVLEVSRREITRTLPDLMKDTKALPIMAALPAIFDEWALQ